MTAMTMQEVPATRRGRTSASSSRLISSKNDQIAAPSPCIDVICCDEDHSTQARPCTEDCLVCPSSPSSACSDIHHISSACTEPTCAAATSSSSPATAAICSAPVVACCDDTSCADAPASACSSPHCAVPAECSSGPVIATCCTDGACEDPQLSSKPAAKPSHTHQARNECRECRGSITAEGGKMYSSFQELLDCCCCSIPPTVVEQCCVGQPSAYPCNTNALSLASSTESIVPPPPPPLSDTPSSSIITNTTSNNRDPPHSRASTASTAATPQPFIPSSPWPSSSYDKHVSFEDIFTELQSWNDCSFEQPHLHSSAGGCLPPAMTLCSSDACEVGTSAPHSHWQDARGQVCQWAGCSERFWTVEELVAHVNHAHLARSGVQVPAVQEQQQGAANLECLWDDCHQVPLANGLGMLTPPVMANDLHQTQQEQNDKFSLAILQHLLHDHLGQERPSQPISSNDERAHLHKAQQQPAKKRKLSFNSSSSSDTKLNDELVCRWEGCFASFASHAALTSHIESVHVGSGHSTYSCLWTGCARFGHTFTQKQKVLRHIQTHTGDRPFKCPHCGNRFSEHNTLQQHLRTHTQEKPYVCDHPGCGKAFAVAGSLTIHKRVHTGSKPFVCTWEGCGKRFGESSNLTKHMRTHTGERPYRCEVCGKGFGRPDQYKRHLKSHERKCRGKGEDGGGEKAEMMA